MFLQLLEQFVDLPVQFMERTVPPLSPGPSGDSVSVPNGASVVLLSFLYPPYCKGISWLTVCSAPSKACASDWAEHTARQTGQVSHAGPSHASSTSCLTYSLFICHSFTLFLPPERRCIKCRERYCIFFIGRFLQQVSGKSNSNYNTENAEGKLYLTGWDNRGTTGMDRQNKNNL